MTQRSEADNPDIRTERLGPWNARRKRPKPGNGICDFCDTFDVKGLTRSPAAGGKLLCHSCVSSSRIRDLLARDPSAKLATHGRP